MVDKGRWAKPLTDADLMPFGEYEDCPMEKVPARYLDWLEDQNWLSTWPRVRGYIEEHRDRITKELEDEETGVDAWEESDYGRTFGD